MSSKVKWLLAAVLGVFSATANAEVGAYAGVLVGTPSVAYGSSSMAYKVFGGYKIREFPVKNAGVIDLAIQGEYINFGNSSFGTWSYSHNGLGVAAIGSWVIPEKWADWAQEKVAVIAKAGGARVASKHTTTFSSYTYNYTGLTYGVGAEYRFTPVLAARASVEFYPNGYDVIGIAGVFKF